MSKIFFIMGKSASGKDSIYNKIKGELSALNTVTLYTTRPIRANEVEGKDYYYISEKQCKEFEDKNQIIEMRAYNTVHGVWKYLTVDDGQISLDSKSYLMIGTLESYTQICNYYGIENVVPIYIEVEDGERLLRAIQREQNEKSPKYAEICRRFLADSEDFSNTKLSEANITHSFVNHNLEECAAEVILFINKKI